MLFKLEIQTRVFQVFFQSGLQQQLFFSPPSKQGSLEWEYEVPSWFKFKWNNLDEDIDGNFMMTTQAQC